MQLEKTLKMNMLFDFYGELLTNKQQDYLHYYYREDYSLGEIAEQTGVTRQAVFDNIRRSEALLNDYEQSLQLYKKNKERQQKMNQLRTYIDKYYDQDQTLQALVRALK